MKKLHPTDNFLSSESAFRHAVNYWKALFLETGILPRADWRVLELPQRKDGSIDLSAGTLVASINVPSKKSFRLSQSERTEKAFLLAHTDECEVDGTHCDRLTLHCSASEQVEGLVILFTMTWIASDCTRVAMDRILRQFLPHEEFVEHE